MRTSLVIIHLCRHLMLNVVYMASNLFNSSILLKREMQRISENREFLRTDKKRQCQFSFYRIFIPSFSKACSDFWSLIWGVMLFYKNVSNIIWQSWGQKIVSHFQQTIHILEYFLCAIWCQKFQFFRAGHLVSKNDVFWVFCYENKKSGLNNVNILCSTNDLLEYDWYIIFKCDQNS